MSFIFLIFSAAPKALSRTLRNLYVNAYFYGRYLYYYYQPVNSHCDAEVDLYNHPEVTHVQYKIQDKKYVYYFPRETATSCILSSVLHYKLRGKLIEKDITTAIQELAGPYNNFHGMPCTLQDILPYVLEETCEETCENISDIYMTVIDQDIRQFTFYPESYLKFF